MTVHFCSRQKLNFGDREKSNDDALCCTSPCRKCASLLAQGKNIASRVCPVSSDLPVSGTRIMPSGVMRHVPTPCQMVYSYSLRAQCTNRHRRQTVHSILPSWTDKLTGSSRLQIASFFLSSEVLIKQSTLTTLHSQLPCSVRLTLHIPPSHNPITSHCRVHTFRLKDSGFINFTSSRVAIAKMAAVNAYVLLFTAFFFSGPMRLSMAAQDKPPVAARVINVQVIHQRTCSCSWRCSSPISRADQGRLWLS
jgi:hypothetical protein